MRYGIHLPQFGRAAVAGAVERAARHAEELGFEDVWVSDHLVAPAEQPYPAPYLCDPLMTLAFAAAATSRIGIGTSVLVGPQYTSPLALANTLATLDYLSAGRLTLGIGAGWSRREFEALHAPFDHRGDRLDEMIDLLRTAWRDDPATHEGTHFAFSDIRVLPKPAHDIPIWVGGASDRALERAVKRGDGYQGLDVKPDAAPALVERLRQERPEESFTISVRAGWDPHAVDADTVKARRDAYESAGIQHVHVALDRGDLDTWMASMDTVASTLGIAPR